MNGQKPFLANILLDTISFPPENMCSKVRATDEKGHWSDKITEVKVTITPYFYKSWWFYLLLAILITVGSYYFYQWKISLYRQQKKQLEKEVAQRTHELELQINN